MTTTNVYFTQGIRSEQLLMEDLIIESLRMYGKELYYIPRTLVSKDEILGEDRLSEFKTAFPIEMYFENIDSYGGQGAFIQKFGLMIEQSATLVVARRRWDQFVGRYGVTTVPDRPNEGDLLWFPMTNSLFEIKFVQHQDPFYQLGKLYVYKLQVELFQYSSERIDTGVQEIDAFETLKSFTTNTTRSRYGEVTEINLINQGSGYTSAPTVTFTSGSGFGAEAIAVLGTDSSSNRVIRVDITNPGTGYQVPPVVAFTGGGGTGATATAVIAANIDKVESFGDNNSFKEQAGDVLFNAFNPFGEVDYNQNVTTPPAVTVISADSSSITSDSTTITADAG
jgi:hypothetical protein